MLVDTHAHLNFADFKDDAPEVIRRSLDGGVWMLNVGSQYGTSKRAVKIAEKYEKGVYAAIGLHPLHVETGFGKFEEEKFDYEKFKELAKSPKVVAMGEIGLDYYWKPKTKRKLELFKEKQRTVICQQLELAKELNLPMIFHCRMAHDDLLGLLQRGRVSLKGVVHCFTGTWEQAQKYLKMGFYLGFNGLIFKMDVGEIIRKTPLDKILIETDCPYLTPLQETGRNEPLYVKYVAEKIAQIKNLSYKEIAKITTENAKKLFKIEKN